MTLSAILVMTTPREQTAARERLAALDWAEVHQQDDAGRLIVTVEADSSEESLERLKAIKRLPGVASAEMVIHCFEDEPGDPPEPTAAVDALNDDSGGGIRRSHYALLKAHGNY